MSSRKKWASASAGRPALRTACPSRSRAVATPALSRPKRSPGYGEIRILPFRLRKISGGLRDDANAVSLDARLLAVCAEFLDRLRQSLLRGLERFAGGPVMAVPVGDVSTLRVNGVDHTVRVAEFRGSDDGIATAPSVAFGAFGANGAPPVSHLQLRLRPSDGGRDDEATIVEAVDLGWRLPFSGATDMTSVGEAIHRFLAADDPSRVDAWRVAVASRLLNAWGATYLDPRHVVEMGTRFRAFVDKRWPGAVLRREAPIIYRVGDRTMSGRLDVVVETSDAIVVVDHKSFPRARPQWLEQARKHGGQLRLYREAITASMSAPKPVQLALHLPIAGEVLMVE